MSCDAQRSFRAAFHPILIWHRVRRLTFIKGADHGLEIMGAGPMAIRASKLP